MTLGTAPPPLGTALNGDAGRHAVPVVLETALVTAGVPQYSPVAPGTAPAKALVTALHGPDVPAPLARLTKLAEGAPVARCVERLSGLLLLA